MISSDILRGYHDMMILYCLLERDSYGYEISKTIQEQSGYSMKETTLYSAVGRLEKNGYVNSYQGESQETFGRRRTYYTMTAQGREYYQEKCREWEETKHLINQFSHLQGGVSI